MHKPTALAAAAALTFAVTAPALADEAEPAPSGSPSETTPSSARAPNGEHVAPLSQRTQPAYVPQSVALSGPAVLPWDPSRGRTPPSGYHAETRVRTGLVVAGSVTWGSMYLITALVAGGIADSGGSYSYDYRTGKSTRATNPSALLYIPVVGPFAYLPHAGSQSATVALLIDGLAQTAGAAMLVAGLTVPRHVLVRNDLAKIELTPMIGPGHSGAGLTGTF